MRLTKAREAELLEQLRDDATRDEHIAFPRESYEQSGDILISRDGLRHFLHRYLWKMVVDPELPRGEFLLKSCTTWGCVNPYHRTTSNGTRPGMTPKQRASRALGFPAYADMNRAKTHCPLNHPYTPENTYVWTDRKGHVHRKCVICTKARRARQSQRERANRQRIQGAS
jgi:hypothetical protein